MSIAEGKRAFNIRLKEAMANSPTYQALLNNYRLKLNTENIHILDISYNALALNADTPEKLDRFDESYLLFLTALDYFIPSSLKFNTLKGLDTINPKKLSSEIIYIEEPPLLICPTFAAARTFITKKVSQQIPFDEFFGVKNRARSKDDLIREGYEVIPILDAEGVTTTGYRIRNKRGRLRVKARYFNAEGLELIGKDSDELRIRELSNLDIGHLYTKETKSTPLNFKLTQLLEVPGISGSLKSFVEAAISNLANISGKVDFELFNNLPSSFKGSYLALTLEFYTLNGAKAKQETAIYNAIKNEIVEQLKQDIYRSIPGSNTMQQDVSDIIKQSLTAAIKGIKIKLTVPKHGKVQGTFKDKVAVKKVVTKSKTVSSGSTPTYGKVSSPLGSTQIDFYSLASLQQLINDKLQSVITANMGRGSETRILNNRTGRFAASAQVERMSQSREGMITAFYSYMKNPYQTFEPGFRQGSPQTRDPKLLIAKSIREIAATKVGNRLRAVSI